MKMKFLLILTIILSLFSSPVIADDITLYLNGEKIVCDSAPIIIKDRTLVPARALFEALGATLSWNDNLKQATISHNNTKIKLTINSNTAFVNGRAKSLDVAPVIVNSRTMMPVRFIAQTFSYGVLWDGVSRSVYITSNSNEDTEEDTKEDNEEDTEEDTKNTIKSIKVTNDKKNVKINLVFNSPLKKHDIFVLDATNVLVLDLYGLSYDNLRTITVNKGIVKQLRMANHEKYYRLAVDVEEKPKYTFKINSDKLSAELSINAGETLELPAESEKPTESDKPVKVEKIRRIVIDAGHGGTDTGAIGYEYIYPDDDNDKIKNKEDNDDKSDKVDNDDKEDNVDDTETNEIDEEENTVEPKKVIKITEKTVTLDIATKVADFLREKGIEVYETRTEDVSVSLRQRYTYANDLDADLFVSVHCNAFTNTDAKGTLTIYSDVKDETYPEKRSSKEIAGIIQKHLQGALQTQDRKTYSDPELAVLKNTTMPAVLIETAFITNPSDMELLMNDTMRTVAARAITEGILEVIDKD